MEEEERRQNLNHQRLRFGEPEDQDHDAASAVGSGAGFSSQNGGGGAGQAAEFENKQSRNHSKRSVRIADGPPDPWQSGQKKQATIRINEARNKTKIKSHSIHGMSEEEAGGRPYKEMGILTYEEKKFLLAVERGDVASTRRMLASPAASNGLLDINCRDPLGRSALLMAIDNENLEMVELMLDNKVETKDALLHAINEEFVEAVEVLLEHEETIHHEGTPHSWEAIPPDTANFTPDITPLVLAAHRDNYEIIKILLDRGATLPMPHDVRCGCEECRTSRQDDSLRHSRSRINAYRALASPSLIALSSKDPILTAFELSWELRRLSFAEHEFKSEYLELRSKCQEFATALLDHTRSSSELEILLNHDPTGPVFQHGERMHLNRLKLAIKYRQKKFVAHPNVQQLLASIWYEGLPGFRQMNMILQFLEVCRIGLLFPLFSLAYIICPWASFSQKLRKPFIKFICTSASYFTFLFLLILASQRIEVVIAEWFQNEKLKEWLSTDVTVKRGSTPTLVECCILAWVVGLIWSEIKQLWDVGLREYITDMWNVVDFVTNALYVATIALRLVAYYRVQDERARGMATADLDRENWDTWDPMLIAEGLFAAANIFSNLKLVYIFSVNPHLGPLQVSLSRMMMDIFKFSSLFFLVLFAFSCGANQLLWYYADLEKKRCYNQHLENVTTRAFHKGSNLAIANITGNAEPYIEIEINHCLAWRRFANLWETVQTLFWAIFGLVDLDNFELTGIKEFTRFSGLLMFGSFSVINIIVLLNLLIAMMNHSYQNVSVSSEKADIEWKFARSKLWISYFEDGGTVPPPFNIIPTPKSLYYLCRWAYLKMCGRRSNHQKKEFLKTKKVRQASERDIRYQAVMRNLVRRYVTQEQRKAENEGVTEDDVNEIKNDISAFRFELIEIMRSSGMNTASATGPSGAAGKKNRQKERRLMKGFNLSAGGAGGGGSVSTPLTGTGPAGGPGIPGTGSGGLVPGQSGSTLTLPSNKKSSLTIAPAEIMIDMSAPKKSPMQRPFFRLARLAKLAGHNAKDGLSQHGILGFGNENTAENTTTNNENDASKTASTTSTGSNPGRSRWGNLIHISKEKTSTSGKLSGQSTLSEDESAGHHHPHNGNKEIRFQTSNTSSNDESAATLALNESLSRQSSAQRKDSKFSKSRNPIQCLNPTELQAPPSSNILRAEFFDDNSASGTKQQQQNRSLQRTFRVDMMNEEDPEQPLLLDEMHQNQSEEVSKETGSGVGHKPEVVSKPEVSITGIHVSPSSSPVPGVVPGGSSTAGGLRSRNPQINSGWL